MHWVAVLIDGGLAGADERALLAADLDRLGEAELILPGPGVYGRCSMFPPVISVDGQRPDISTRQLRGNEKTALAGGLKALATGEGFA